MNVDVAVGALMIVGLAGTVVPFLPGLPVIIIAALIWVVADGSDPGQWIVFAIVTAIAGAAIVAGSVVPARRASQAGAPAWVLVFGGVGLIVGAIAIPVVGALVGWPLGILLGEWMRTRDLTTAWATTRATIVGVGLSVAIQLGAGVVAVAIWAVAAVSW